MCEESPSDLPAKEFEPTLRVMNTREQDQLHQQVEQFAHQLARKGLMDDDL
jgi:hypothetical protein